MPVPPAALSPGAPNPGIPQSYQMAPHGPDGTLYAGFWLRVVATILDAFVLAVPLFVVIAVLAVTMGIAGALQNIRPDEGPSAVLALVGFTFILAVLGVSVVVGWLYFAGLESSAWQGTLGKKALGLYVTDLHGNRVTFARASGRYFGGRFLGHVPGFGGLYFLIDCIMAGLTSGKQAIHDMIASTLVLRKS